MTLNQSSSWPQNPVLSSYGKPWRDSHSENVFCRTQIRVIKWNSAKPMGCFRPKWQLNVKKSLEPDGIHPLLLQELLFGIVECCPNRYTVNCQFESSPEEGSERALGPGEKGCKQKKPLRGTPRLSLRRDLPNALLGTPMLGKPVNKFGSHKVYIKGTFLKIETRGIVLLPHWFSKQEGFVLKYLFD